MTLLKGKRRSPNIVRGGRAIPFGNPNDNLYYLQGRSHAKGGIDIGANPRTGIEAEGGEVVQIKPNELRVLSAQDFIGGGVSPAKQVLAGANPDKVFNEQERFKDRHRLNDDGSKYEKGGNIPQFIKDYALQRQIEVAKNDRPLNNIYPEAVVLGLGRGLYNAFGKSFINLSKEFTKKQIRRIKGAKEIGKEIASETGEGIILSNIDNIDNQKRNGGKIVDKVNESDADFVDRLKTPMRRTITDWATQYTLNPKIATHKLSVWEIDNNKGLIVPNVQNVNGKLIDFTRPPYNERAGLENAIKNNDVVILNNYDDAKWYTENYKNYYPNFKNGGMITTINGNVKNGLISTPRPKAKGGTDIHIKPSKRGTFTAAAKAHGKSVQGFASQVLANKDNYSSAMVKKANFARNASKWNHKAYGGRKKFEPGGEKTITDVDRGDKKNDKIWLETFGTDSDILNRARYDTEAMNAMARRHADLVEASGYNPDSGKAIQHEGVGQYQQDFNSKFWNPNRRLYNEITPAGNSGDNQLGSFNDKDYMGNMTYLRTPTGLYTPETVEFWRRKGFRATNYKGYNQLEYMLNPLKAPDIDINVPNPKLSDLSPIGHNTSPTGGQDKTPQNPTPRRGIRWNDDLTSLAGNVLGSLGSFGVDLWGANLRSWTPYTESPVKLKTNWNINPQLDRIRESSQEAYRDIDANTASSSTALARKQRVRNQAQYAANEQWGLKENKETELINKDKLNLQGVRNRNTNRLNTWAESDANIANMRRRLRGAAVSNLFDNLNKSLQGYIGRRDQRRKDEATERMFNRAYPHGAAMARGIQSRESSGDATIPSLATNPIAIVGRLATERLDDDIVAQTKKRCGGKIKRK